MTKKIMKLKIKHSRQQKIEVDTLPSLFHCPKCERQVEVLTINQIGQLLEMDDEKIEQLIANSQLHALTTVTGSRLICKESLLGP